MAKVIQLYRHQESIKDPIRGKIPTPEGVKRSYQAGLEHRQYDSIRGYHSSATRTKMALELFLTGSGKGSIEQLDLLDGVEGPDSIKKRRKDLGDDEAMRINLSEYDKSIEGELASYYKALQTKGQSIADWIMREITKEDNDLVAGYNHDPGFTISVVELAKRYLKHDGKDNVECFKRLTGSDKPRFLEGTGYRIEKVEEDGEEKIYLVTDAGRFELNLSEPESELEDKVKAETEGDGECDGSG